MGWLRLVLRSLQIASMCAIALIVYAARRLTSGQDRERVRGQVLTSLLERLGATFIKFGQILSTRPDVLGPGYTDELMRLQDAVPPDPFPIIASVLDRELAEGPRSQIRTIDEVPVAAASVAQVHRATLRDGTVAALKIQRPAAPIQIHRDMAILRFGARLCDWLPSLRMLSLPGAVARFGEALQAQLDFRVEAENNRRFAANFAEIDGVDVPALIPEICTERVLGMEFIEGVKATEPERVGGNRRRLAEGGARCILKMVFIDGFVHADLHPGNIILTPNDRVVLVDFGVVSEIPPDLMRPWVETFLALAQQDGVAAARLFYTYAPSVGPRASYDAFERDITRYFEGFYGKKLDEVEVGDVVSGAMNVLRKHQIQVDSTFTVVNIALLVAEGLGKQLDPSIDLVEVASPYLQQALLAAPEPRPPPRPLPSTPPAAPQSR